MPSLFIQPNRYSCGTLSVLHAITLLGGVTDYETVYDSIGTTSREGTSDDGIIEGLRLLGYRALPYTTRYGERAWRYITRHSAIHPVILCVDDDNHWVCTAGKINRLISIADSDPNVRKNESGLIVYHKQELLDRWKNSRGVYYAIRVKRGQ